MAAAHCTRTSADAAEVMAADRRGCRRRGICVQRGRVRCLSGGTRRAGQAFALCACLLSSLHQGLQAAPERMPNLPSQNFAHHSMRTHHHGEGLGGGDSHRSNHDSLNPAPPPTALSGQHHRQCNLFPPGAVKHGGCLNIGSISSDDSYRVAYL